MSYHINSTVTPTFQFVYDAQGESNITIERLNQLASPTVTTDLTGLVALSDLNEEIVTLLPKVTISSANGGTGVSVVSIQVVDSSAASNPILGTYAFTVWASDNNKGAVDIAHTLTIDPSNDTELIATLETSSVLYVQTNGSGLAEITSTQTPGDINYFMVEIGNVVYSAQVTHP